MVEIHYLNSELQNNITNSEIIFSCIDSEAGKYFIQKQKATQFCCIGSIKGTRTKHLQILQKYLGKF